MRAICLVNVVNELWSYASGLILNAGYLNGLLILRKGVKQLKQFCLKLNTKTNNQKQTKKIEMLRQITDILQSKSSRMVRGRAAGRTCLPLFLVIKLKF